MKRLSGLERRAVVAARLVGGSCRAVGELFGVSAETVSRIGHDAGVVDEVLGWSPRTRLSFGDREEISRGLAAGLSVRAIAAQLGRSPSTVSREVARNGGPDCYRAARAQGRAWRSARRPKQPLLVRRPELAAVVAQRLQKCWSPVQISASLRCEFGDDELMQVSAETIYQALYLHGRGGLRKELTRQLRTQRQQRRGHPPSTRARRNGDPLPGAVSIRERPDDVEQRLVPGDWEGDLIMGRNNGSQVATMVDRSTGFVLLTKLPSKRADIVAARLADQIRTLPTQLYGTLTWDRGSEMAAHQQFTMATGMTVYFCDPHAPWQRGSSENVNGLLRQYLPRHEDLSRYSQADLDAIAAELNERPRKRYDFRSPLEMLNSKLLH